jgi:transcriptional regulator with XRE-family HTH domain
VALIPLIASRLRALRAKHHLTQEEFAQGAGFGFKFYQQLETGRKKQIWLETVERLAAAYGVEPWKFIGPSIPTKTKLTKKIPASSVHYKNRKRR